MSQIAGGDRIAEAIDEASAWGVCAAAGVPVAEAILVANTDAGLDDEMTRQHQMIRARTRPVVRSAELWTGARLFYGGRTWLVRWGAEPDPPAFVYAARVWGIRRGIDEGGQDGARRLTLLPDPPDGTELLVIKAEVTSSDGRLLAILLWTPDAGVVPSFLVADEGSRAIEALERRLSRRGKREGDGATWETHGAFAEALAVAVADHEGATGRQLRSSDRDRIENKLGIGKTTLYDWTRTVFGLRWGDFVRQRPDRLADFGGINRNRTAA